MASSVDEIIVVLGAYAEEIKPHLLKHKKLKVVYNKDYNLGQTSSFQRGLEAINARAKGLMLLPVDYPFVQSATLDQLIQNFRQTAPLILIPTYNGKKGHPPIFSAQLKSRFEQLPNQKGINTISWQEEQNTVLLAVDDPGITATFNTPEELRKVEQLIPKS